LLCDLGQDFCLRYLLAWDLVRPESYIRCTSLRVWIADNTPDIKLDMAAFKVILCPRWSASAFLLDIVHITICRSIYVLVQGHPCTSSPMYQTLRDAVYHQSSNNIHIRWNTIPTQLEQLATLDPMIFSYNSYA
jgi:hypothetical protein